MSLLRHWRRCKALRPPFLRLSSLRVLRYRSAVCHAACSSLCLRSGSSCVLHPSSFIPSSVPLHSTRSPPTICSKAWQSFPSHNPTLHTLPQTQAPSLTVQEMPPSPAHTFLQSLPISSLSSIPLHSVVHSFQKGSVHPLPIFVLACAAAGCVPGLHWHNSPAYALFLAHFLIPPSGTKPFPCTIPFSLTYPFSHFPTKSPSPQCMPRSAPFSVHPSLPSGRFPVRPSRQRSQPLPFSPAMLQNPPHNGLHSSGFDGSPLQCHKCAARPPTTK